MYRYLNIRGAADYSVFLPVEHILKVLVDFPEFSQSSERRYESASGSPWISLSIVACDSHGNYPAGISQTADTANLVELICSDSGDGRRQAGDEKLAMSIAEALGWDLVDCESAEQVAKTERA